MRKLMSLLVAGSLCCVAGAYADDETALNQAMRALDARAKSAADKKLVLTAVSQQTQVPEKTLETQLRTSHLSYGELLTANSLAGVSRTSLENILARKAKSMGWAALSRELKIAPASIVNRIHNAEKTVQAAQERMAKSGNTKNSNNVDPSKVTQTPPPMTYKPGP
jgi:lambda repressor-like predicted transcriptional regulator